MTLPVASILHEIVRQARESPVIVAAPPGSGKTTLVPPALLDDLGPAGTVVLVQPRRVAARAVARRIAEQRGGRLGDEVGYQVRFERCAGRDTRLLVVTTGILLRRLSDDIGVEDVAAIVLDEFHERTVEMDLALAMAWRLRQTIRPDLRLAVMSATLDAAPISRLLDDCPVLRAEGQVFPVATRHVPVPRDPRALPEQLAHVVPDAARETPGHLLVFLPGVGEILRSRELLAPWAERAGFDLLPLYGDLPPEQQDRALAPSERRKVILATNVAETSLTIEGVTGVVDSGLARQLRVHPEVGLPRLDLVPISRASAEQRTGRAGRTAPGICWRLWEQASHAARPAQEPPEILRADLAEPLLRLLVWGERDLAAVPWVDSPPAEAIESARLLLRRLGAIDDAERVTPLGERLSRLPTHPRLARLLLAGAERGVLRECSLAAALLSERDPFRAGERARRGPRDRARVRSRSDIVDRVLLLAAVHELGRGGGRGDLVGDGDLSCHVGAARQVLRAAEQLFRLVDAPRGERAADIPEALRRCLLDAFPDRVARPRAQHDDRGVMVGGRGVRIDDESRVHGEPLFLCVELHDSTGDARARLVSAVEREWLPDWGWSTGDELFFHPTRKQVEARRRTSWLDLTLEETPVAIEDRAGAAELLARAARPELARLLPGADEPAGRFRRRVAWLAATLPELGLPPLDNEQLASMLTEICHGLRSFEELRRAPWLAYLQQAVGHERLAELERLAPEQLTAPSGNRFTLDYEPGKAPVLAVRIQEIFGWAETPRVAGGRVPVLLHLLGPNHRPQQVTNDLASFWRTTYEQVKKELRRRYPKHHWPDDPTTARPSRSGLSRDA